MEWNKAPSPILLGYNLESTQAPLCCWLLPVPRPAFLFWHSNKTVLSFSSGLLFCHSAICGISLASKKHECGKTSAYRAAVLLNTMPNLFFKHPERLFLLPPWGDNSTSHLLFIAVTLILIFNLNYSFFLCRLLLFLTLSVVTVSNSRAQFTLW